MHITTKLRDETRGLLKNRPASLTNTKIAEDLNISIDWLTKFRDGKIENPGVVTIESLNVYLKNYISKVR